MSTSEVDIKFALVLYKTDKSTKSVPVHQLKLILEKNELKDFKPQNKNDYQHLSYDYGVESECGKNCTKRGEHVHCSSACIQKLASKYIDR